MTAPTPKRGPGRPRTRPADLASFTMRMSRAELDALTAAAEAAGQDRQAFARAALVRASKRRNDAATANRRGR